MKKHFVLLCAILLMFGAASCSSGSDHGEGGEVGGDWHTWGGYVPMEWKSPDGTDKIYMESRESTGEIRLLAEGDTYTVICDCTLPAADRHDWALIQNSIHCADKNGDGYDDLVLKDSDGTAEVELVYIWNAENCRFVSEENGFDQKG